MKALIIQHTKNEGPGLLGQMLTEREWDVDICCLEEGASLPRGLGNLNSLVILGGPMGAYQEEEYPYLIEVQELIQKAVQVGLPTLGICLGGQLMARALGAKVGPNPEKEIGWYSLEVLPQGSASPLFNGIPSNFMAFQWHQDTFDLPLNAQLLASSPACVNQAFRYGDCLWGLQFHPEVSPAMIIQWLEAGPEDLQGLPGLDPAQNILKMTRAIWPQAQEIQSNLLNNIEVLLHP
ncbi:MAG TPA: type 1 glutamine amidotransferase [Syntrophomonadaceae bacterium]|nr:type 1 glutamine amidotransferase [Syntrophomonadaceae bacterium]